MLVPKTYVSARIIQCGTSMYDGANSRVRTPHGNRTGFETGVGLHQGRAPIPLLHCTGCDQRDLQNWIVNKELLRSLTGEFVTELGENLW